MMVRRSFASFVLALVVSVWTAAPASAQRAKPKLTLVMVADGPDESTELRKAVQHEVTQVLSSSREVVFLPALEADLTQDGAATKLGVAFGNPEVDAVIGVGLYVTAAVAAREALPKPVVLPRVAEGLQGLPLADGKSGRENLVYVGGMLTLERDLRRLNDIVPFEHVAVLLDPRVRAELPVARAIAQAAQEVGVRATPVPCEGAVEAVVAAVPDDARVVYLPPLPGLSDAQRRQLIEGLNARERLVFSMRGPSDIPLGAFASLNSPKDDLRRGRRTALLLERILNGESPGELSVTYEPEEELTLNRGVARAQGVTPRAEILIEAKVEGERPSSNGAGPLDLRGAVQRAMAENLDVGVSEQDVAAREQSVKRARGKWLPQLRAEAGFTWVDPDGASAFGPAERTLAWGIEGRQALYSRDRYADLGSAKQRFAASDADLSTTRLDIGVQAATAYLNVLRASVVQQINEENLEQTRQNLHLAEARVAAGAAGRDEVYRWQAEVARRRTDVLTSIADRQRAEVVLNRYLNRPLESTWDLSDVEIPDVVLMLPGREEFLATNEGLEGMRAFMVQRALRQSPELKSLDSSIEGQRIVVKSREQSFYAPTVSAVGGFQHLPGTWGAGSETAATGTLPVPVPVRDEFAWSVGVEAALPLFEGNSRTAELREQSRELARLQTQRASTAQRIEQRVRSSFIRLGGSYPAVALAKQAAQAADKNLEVVTDKYRRGATDIIRLIDAQNNALLSDLARASAVYDFLIDYVNAERSTGSLMFILDAPAREQILSSMADFIAERGGNVAPSP